jgi:hypothetical protein
VPMPEACCFADDSCDDLDPTECGNQGGTTQGAGSDCATVVCGGAPAMPGEVPSGTAARPGVPFEIEKGAAGTDLDFTWTVSCSAEAIDQTVHEGTLGTWYSHDSILCTTSGCLTCATVTPLAGNRYFLIVPVTAVDEGSYGIDSFGIERPVSGTSCLPTSLLTCP